MKRQVQLLVVDDDPHIRDMFRLWAESEAYQVRCAGSWKEMAETMRDFTPDVIVLDLMIPEVDGIEILYKLAASDCKASIVLSTGHDGTLLEVATRIARAKNLLVAGVLAKPIDLEGLRDVMSRALTFQSL